MPASCQTNRKSIPGARGSGYLYGLLARDEFSMLPFIECHLENVDFQRDLALSLWLANANVFSASSLIGFVFRDIYCAFTTTGDP
jgi:hypothetical protein